MATEQKQIGTLAGQLAFLTYRLGKSEMIIDVLKKNVSTETYKTICAEVEGKIGIHSPDSISKMRSILVETNPNMSAQQIDEILAELKSPKH